MADMCDTCNDGVVDLLKKLLSEQRDSFVRLGQINQTIAGADGSGDNVSLVGINGVVPSVGCGVATPGTLRVAQATDCPVTVTGTVTSTPTGVQDIQGNVAHDSVDSGNPVKTGAVAIAHGTNPTAVAAGDRTNLYANRAGVPFVIGGHPNIITIRANAAIAQTNVAVVTVGAGVKIVVTAASIVVANSNTVDVSAILGFGAATTPTTTGVVASHPGIAPGSGYARGDGSGILGIGADGEDLRITNSVPTGGSMTVLVSYYTIES